MALTLRLLNQWIADLLQNAIIDAKLEKLHCEFRQQYFDTLTGSAQVIHFKYSMQLQHQSNLIGVFAQHKVAANLLMLIMLLAGVWALDRLNIQFFPNFQLDYISVRVIWTGTTAEDVETSITRPIEQALRTLDYVRKITSTSANGAANITLEYEEGSDMGMALDQVKEQISLLRNLPTDSEKPEITRIVRYDPIATLLITGVENTKELRHLVQRFERELLDRGISKVEIAGLPEEEIAIQVPIVNLENLGLTLTEIGQQVAYFSRDLPAGTVGREDVARQLRSLEQRRNELAFAQIPLIADTAGRLVKLEDVAVIERRPRQSEASITYQGKAAVELVTMRAENNDALKSAQILHQWLDDIRPTLPANVQIIAFDEAWLLIKERIMLLVNNGLSGLVLVVITLLLFLNTRVAFWVAMGIPVSMMGMLAVLYITGGSINMISLFAMIMALGIVVDDAIVVGEDAFTHFQMGQKSALAAEGGAQRMLAPVLSSSLTTMAAFLPLMLVGGPMGNILFDIPMVMICVLTASLVECFFVLPGHLRVSLHKIRHLEPNPLRRSLERGFDHIRDTHFRSLVTTTIEYRWATLSAMVAIMVLAVGVLVGGRVNFTFFPTPEDPVLTASVNFVSGTPPQQVDDFIAHLEQTLYATETELGGHLVNLAIAKHRSTTAAGAEGAVRRGDQFGSLRIELVSPDLRQVRNAEFIKVWRSKINIPPGLETLTITERRHGPPGQDIEIRFYGNDPEQMKMAVQELAKALQTFSGVSAIEDDMPFGQEQWIYTLTPHGEALGLTIESVGRQLRAAFDGYRAQIFQDGDDEVEVRILLPDAERHSLATLENFTLQLASGGSIPFSTAVQLKTRRGFEALRHAQGRLAAQVSATVDNTVTNSNKILDDLKATVLPDLSKRYLLEYSFEGRAADQEETLSDMKRGLLFAFALIYLILAWQFASYGWPLIVMIIIPFGLIGALFGHLVMGLDLTILSLFGFFGLSGIVINDSIVLVTFYRDLRAEGMAIREALIEAACQRLRAVLLTSLTTIFGLLPLLFETSFQAQFLIPMATSIAFGLIFSTVLVLVAIPALLSIYESFAVREEEWEGLVNESA